MNSVEIEKYSIAELLDKYSFIEDFFIENNLDKVKIFEPKNKAKSFPVFLDELSEDESEDFALNKEELLSALDEFILQMKQFLNLEDANTINNITIIAGTDKSGAPENFEDLTFHTSQVIAIVGNTGSGKSRLLADIEWLAQNDTPTHRKILINGNVPDKMLRFSVNNKLVAQLSQNMNFVMDLSVEEFITLHAESRMVEDVDSAIKNIIEAGNKLAGESFDLQTQITALSGGQSRALMIADTAILSSSPIVLIDEIENAGIDRRKALDLLLSKEKIVLMATHDPALALYADKRIVIKNGGIANIIETSQHEKEVLAELELMDAKFQSLRTKLRAGEEI